MAASHSRAGNGLCLFAVLGHIDDGSLLIRVLHPFLGKGRPDDIAGQILHGRIVIRRDTVSAEDVKPRIHPSGEHPRHLPGNLPLTQEHLQCLMPENGLQLFQLQERSDAEEAPAAAEAAICDEDVVVRIESEKIAKCLDGDDGTGDGIILRNCVLEKYLQGFSDEAAQIGKKFRSQRKYLRRIIGMLKTKYWWGIFLRTSIQSHSPNPTTCF